MRNQSMLGILIIISLSACLPKSIANGDLNSSSVTSTMIHTDELVTPLPLRTRGPKPSSTSISTPSPTSDHKIEKPDNLRETFIRILGTHITWDIPEETLEKWKAYAQGDADLTVVDVSALSDFVNRWLSLTSKMSENKNLDTKEVVIKAQIFRDPLGNNVILPYLVRNHGENAQYYLIARDQMDQITSLMPAPIIPGLNQQIGLDGESVDYLDPRGRIMLYADAVELPQEEVNILSDHIQNSTTQKDDPFKVMLVTGNNTRAESTNNVFSRYKVAVEGINAVFYGLDTSLTDKQIILLNEAFDIFNRPEFSPFKQIFQSNVSVFMLDDLGKASGMNYTGTGVIVIDRIDLFGNKYLLASVLAHEGTHILQGQIPNGKDQCLGLQQMEIGRMSIPDGFYNWSADQVIEGVKSQQLGAYHVSLWMLSRLGYSNLKFLRDAIYTGKINGQSVVIDCK